MPRDSPKVLYDQQQPPDAKLAIIGHQAVRGEGLALKGT